MKPYRNQYLISLGIATLYAGLLAYLCADTAPGAAVLFGVSGALSLVSFGMTLDARDE